MPELVRVKLADGTETSVGESFAKSKGLEILDAPAADVRGTVPTDTSATLKGKALDAALEEAGLDKTGTVKEKQARLSDFQTSGSQAGGTTP